MKDEKIRMALLVQIHCSGFTAKGHRHPRHAFGPRKMTCEAVPVHEGNWNELEALCRSCSREKKALMASEKK